MNSSLSLPACQPVSAIRHHQAKSNGLQLLNCAAARQGLAPPPHTHTHKAKGTAAWAGVPAMKENAGPKVRPVRALPRRGGYGMHTRASAQDPRPRCRVPPPPKRSASLAPQQHALPRCGNGNPQLPAAASGLCPAASEPTPIQCTRNTSAPRVASSCCPAAASQSATAGTTCVQGDPWAPTPPHPTGPLSHLKYEKSALS